MQCKQLSPHNEQSEGRVKKKKQAHVELSISQSRVQIL